MAADGGPGERRGTTVRVAAVRIAAAALAVLLLAELALRLGEDRLTEPVTWYHPSAQVKVAQMDDLAAAGEPVDVVAVGTSQMAMGVDPDALAAALPGQPSVYNAAVLAGYPEVTRRFVPEEVVPRLRPGTVVLGVAVSDLQPGAAPPYESSLATSRSRWAGAERWLADRLHLVRYRRLLRDPGAWAGTLAGTSEGAVEYYERLVIGPAGEWRYGRTGTCDGSRRSPSAPDMAGEGAGGDGPAAPSEGPLVIDPAREDAIWATVAALRQAGPTVVVVLMPLPSCTLSTTSAADAFEAGRRRLAARAGEVGVPFVDVADQVRDDRFFHDPGHLNEQGSARFTELLAGELAELLPD